MSDPSSLTISIERASLSLSALVLCGHNDPSRFLSISDYTEPGRQPRVSYAPQSDDIPDTPLGFTWQEALIGFNVFNENATGESDTRSKIADLSTALARLSYSVTITVNDADPETWTCRPGAVVPAAGRTLTDLQTHGDVWSVSIPAYPIRSL